MKLCCRICAIMIKNIVLVVCLLRCSSAVITTNSTSDQIIYLTTEEKYQAICVMDINGRNTRELYRDYGKHLSTSLAVSEDGKWLAFLKGNKDMPGIDYPYAASIINLLNLNNLKVLEIEKEQPYDIPSYSWSPVSNQIAYPDLHGNLYVYDADGGSKRIVVTGDSLSLSEHVRWSPDGWRLAGIQASRLINVITLDNPVPLSINAVDYESGPIQGMIWLTDQELLFFPNEKGLFKINVTTREKATFDQHQTLEIALSPDRQLIAAVQEDNSGSDFSAANIYTFGIDGFNRKRLTDRATNGEPCWSSDNRRILFTSNRDGHAEIYIMDVDGQNQTRLTYTRNGDSYNPVWVKRH